MKKLLLVLAFAFIGQQAFSQMYIVTISGSSVFGCSSSNPYEATLTKVTPAGSQTHTCIPRKIEEGSLVSLNQELNSIISQGYKLVETNYADGHGLLTPGSMLDIGSVFIFAIP